MFFDLKAKLIPAARMTGFRLRAIAVAVLWAIGTMSPAPVRAEPFDYDPSKPMVFRKAGDGGNCNGCSWIVAEGTIQRDTPQLFQRFLDERHDGNELVFNSPGGDLAAALRLGDMIRARGFQTAVGKTTGEFTDSAYVNTIDGGRTKGKCAAACVYAFLGGARRSARDDELGIQQFHDSEAVKEPLTRSATAIDRSNDQAQLGSLLDYVIRMDVSPKLVAMAAAVTPWRDIRWLKRQDLLDLGIDNSADSYSPLTVEAFGASGAYVETVSRTRLTAFRHRLYCRGNAATAYLALIPNYEIDDVKGLEATMRTVMENRSVILIADGSKRRFPLQLAALDSSPTGLQASAQIVGATMADLQAAKRVEFVLDGLGNVEAEVAAALTFDLAGDRRKIGIAARSCVR